MKVKEIVTAYKTLGEAKVNNLEESEILKIIKARKAMRTIAEEFEAFLKDAQDKFKPENFEELQTKAQTWSDLSDKEKIEISKTFKAYDIKLNGVLNEELEKEVDITLGKLTEDSISKLLKNNEWSVGKLDDLSIML